MGTCGTIDYNNGRHIGALGLYSDYLKHYFATDHFPTKLL